MNRATRISRMLLLCLLMAFVLAGVPAAIAEEAAEGEAATDDLTGTYGLAGKTNSGKDFTAVIVVWDNGDSVTVRGMVPQVGPITKDFALVRNGDGTYLVSGGVNWRVIKGSGSATISKTSNGFDMGGSASGSAFFSDGSVTFGGARVTTDTDGEVSTTVGEEKDAASGAKPMAGADSAVQPLTPDSGGEIPPVEDTTKAGLAGALALLIAIQIVLEVVMGGGISKERIGELLTSGAAAATGSSVADAADSVGDIGQSASEGGDE